MSWYPRIDLEPREDNFEKPRLIHVRCIFPLVLLPTVRSNWAHFKSLGSRHKCTPLEHLGLLTITILESNTGSFFGQFVITWVKWWLVGIIQQQTCEQCILSKNKSGITHVWESSWVKKKSVQIQPPYDVAAIVIPPRWHERVRPPHPFLSTWADLRC